MSQNQQDDALASSENLSKPKPKSKYKGAQPNLLWKAIDRDELAAFKTFIPLTEKSANPNDTRMILQHSQEWHDIRRVRLTGSILNAALGFFEKENAKRLGLASYYVSHQKLVNVWSHLRSAYFALPSSGAMGPQFEEHVQMKMDWGTIHEANGLATFAKAFPNYMVRETGFWKMDNSCLPKQSTDHASPFYVDLSELPQMGASPDGLLYNVDQFDINTSSIVALLAPFDLDYASQKNAAKNAITVTLQESHADHIGVKFDLYQKLFQYKKRSPHDKVPIIYIPQMMCQMMVTKASKCYFLSWTPTDGTNIFEVAYDEEYMALMLRVVADFYKTYVIQANATLPETNVYSCSPHYDVLIQKTLQLAASYTILKTPISEVKNGEALFLDE